VGGLTVKFSIIAVSPIQKTLLACIVVVALFKNPTIETEAYVERTNPIETKSSIICG
jgi:hypothetical protein